MIIGFNKLVPVKVKDEVANKFPFVDANPYFGFISIQKQIVPIVMTHRSIFVNNSCRGEYQISGYGLQTVFYHDEPCTKLVCDIICGGVDKTIVINFSPAVFEKAVKSAQFLLNNDGLVDVPKLSIFSRLFMLLK